MSVREDYKKVRKVVVDKDLWGPVRGWWSQRQRTSSFTRSGEEGSDDPREVGSGSGEEVPNYSAVKVYITIHRFRLPSCITV